MSPLGGIETTRRLKADPRLRAIPVILAGASRDQEAALEAGADGFVVRPATRAALLTQIRRFVPAEERATQRVAVGLKVTCRSGDESFVAFTRDLSPTGLFLKSPRPPTTGSRLFVSFVLPGEDPSPIESEAEVVREVSTGADPRGMAGSGLQFTSLPAGTRMQIGRFLRASGRA
jgi:uncharacterized protein (TIGR02266 family)